ncbi:N-formylglutamate amidohydrolase [Patescibacteria group bacterium]|nr:N-formylglutamate amidohydrolase [Patescibacteria group bacterium]
MGDKKHPILVSIPHGSTFVPAELRRRMHMTDRGVKLQSDPYTVDIFDVPNAYVVKARISRLVVDLNRAPDDIEMELKLSADGVVVSVDLDGKPIYKDPPSFEVIAERVNQYHDMFHEKIEELKPKIKFLIDGHSMRSKGPVTKADSGQERADVVLGNRDYTTCSRKMTRKIMKFFEEKGFSVAINNPYKGRYIIGYHCSRRGLPGIQIELNERLYMGEKTHKPHKKKIQKLNQIVAELVEVLHTALEKEEGLSRADLSAQGSLF